MDLPPALFSGPASLRVRGEMAALVGTLAALAVAIAGAHLLSYVLTTVFSWKEVALVIVVGMVYVTLGRGRLLGGSIRVHAGQFGDVHRVVTECCARLRMTPPQVFVRDDPFVPIVAVGIGEPYAIVIAAQWVEHISEGELRFLVGRELAHILAGHTRVTSLLSVNGRENALISIVFGAWLRKIEYTADRLGLLCCGSLDAAVSAISVSAFHSVGRKIDLNAFADQQRELEADPSLRMGEWISSTPFATNRIFALRAFARDAAFLEWMRRLDRGTVTSSVRPVQPDAPLAVSRKAFAGPMRRLYAWIIDFALVNALLPAVNWKGHVVSIKSDDPDVAAIGHALNGLVLPNDGNVAALVLLAYCVVLVGLTGQTCGMMILDLRVVNDRYGKAGFGRALLRYAMQVASYTVAPVGWFRFWGRVQPYEKWSRTRLLEGAQFAARADAISAPPLAAR